MASTEGTARRSRGWASVPIADLACPVLLAPELAKLRAVCDLCHVAAGRAIFKEGETVADVRIVAQGRVKLTRLVRGRSVTVMLLRAGGVLGDVSLLSRTPSCYDAIAVTDVSLLTLPAPRFTAMLGELPGFAAYWVGVSAGCLASLERRVVELLAGDVHSQVAAVILQRLGRGRSVDATQQTIADLLGVQRTSVSRALRDLGDRGVVTVRYSRIDVVDRTALRRVAFGAPPVTPVR